MLWAKIFLLLIITPWLLIPFLLKGSMIFILSWIIGFYFYIGFLIFIVVYDYTAIIIWLPIILKEAFIKKI